MLKKFTAILLISPLLIHAAMNDKDPEDSMLLSQGSKQMFQKEQKTASAAVTKDITNQIYGDMKEQNSDKAKQAAAAAQRQSSDIMIVDPNVVAKDWVNAFEALNIRGLSSIKFVLRDQSIISDVSSLDAMPGGYLMLFTLKTVQGTKYRVVKTSDISSLETR